MASIKRSERITEKAFTQAVYSDFTIDMDKAYNSRDLLLLKNEDAVKSSIRNILLTNRNERPFNPFLGSDINAILFENITPATTSLLKEFIVKSIENFEPRAKLITVEVSPSDDLNQYFITVVFTITTNPQPVALDLILNRVR